MRAALTRHACIEGQPVPRLWSGPFPQSVLVPPVGAAATASCGPLAITGDPASGCAHLLLAVRSRGMRTAAISRVVEIQLVRRTGRRSKEDEATIAALAWLRREFVVRPSSPTQTD